MRQRLLMGAIVALIAIFSLPAAAQQGQAQSWIVVLHDGADARGVAAEHSRRYEAQVSHVYEYALKGYAAVIPDRRVAEVRSDPRVDYMERDGTATVFVQHLPWGIDKIDADTSSTKAGDGTGTISNVNVYIIDTGVDKNHSDLYVVNHVNFAGGRNADCNGHGTHVAGTAAARDNTSDVVGVAPGAPVTGVKVLGCNGSGSYSGVIAGVDWVTANAKKPATANMSLGGPTSQALDDAVRNSANSGVFYAIAAGNDGADACSYSPARAGTHSGVMTVAATNDGDLEASWSNYGTCVDIWAPGVSILSTLLRGGTTTKSGTSMASPHVGGGGALYLSSHTGDSAATVESVLLNNATKTLTTSKDGSAITRLYVGGF